MKKRALCAALAALLCAAILPTGAIGADLPFTDVPEDAWYRGDVAAAVAGGLVNGRTETSFCPDEELTYAEAVKLAACMRQKAAEGTVTLQNGDPWYQSYADYAKEAGIIAKDYDWNAPATRAGYIEIFAHALPDEALTEINEVPDSSVPDVPMDHPQAAEIYKLYRAGILEGSEDSYRGAWTAHLCKPSDTIRRSEVAAILTRMTDASARKTFTLTDSASSGFAARYFRTDGYRDGVSYPFALTFSGPDELMRYYDTHKDLYDFSRHEVGGTYAADYAADAAPCFADAVAAYDAAWFRSHRLILVVLEEGSGSVRHRVDGVRTVGNETTVDITRLVPEVGTDDMAEWHILIEVGSAAQTVRVRLDNQNPVGEAADPRSDSEKAADFAVRLFRRCFAADGDNTLVSPLSVFGALAMTSNGAKGETLAEMEDVLGMKNGEMNLYFATLLDRLAEEGSKKENEPRFHLANSVWFIDDESFTVNEDFLEMIAFLYDAGVNRAPFDAGTLKEINDWVKEQTDGMIPSILDRIPEDAVMYLVNALAFEGEWADPYQEHQVRPGTFTREDGTKTTADLMWSKVNSYLEDDGAEGFIRYYKGGKYAFAALLPDEGTALSDYVASLDGEKLVRILSSAQSVPVDTALPKFETEYGAELSKLLAAMGMKTAFDPDAADFSGLGTSTAGNICISRVLHKTFISVAEQGTKAGAATVVEMVAKSAMPPQITRTVVLDRPFVYMLIDCETNVPFFIGALTSVGE